MTSAGGFFYHLRALHSARSAWSPFRSALEEWLAELRPGPSLVLVGPSAGHCLPDSLFQKFESLTVLEPDPIARWLLARRLERLDRAPARFERQDLLFSPLMEGGAGLDELLRRLPGATVLFANLLGQATFLLEERRLGLWKRAWSERMVSALAGRQWASFHDRVSGSVAPRIAMPHREPRRLTDAELGARFFTRADGRVVLHDHHTLGLFSPSLPHTYFHWELEPGAHHLVEAVSGTGHPRGDW